MTSPPPILYNFCNKSCCVRTIVVWKLQQHARWLHKDTGCVRTIVVWKQMVTQRYRVLHWLRENHSGMETRSRPKPTTPHSALRENHSGMETLGVYGDEAKAESLRENHSGMETILYQSKRQYFHKLRENHSGMETQELVPNKAQVWLVA